MAKALMPKNVTRLKSFSGLVTFYAKFLPHLLKVLHPLYQLLEKDSPWKWTLQCQQAVNEIKLLCSIEVSTLYNVHKLLRL